MRYTDARDQIQSGDLIAYSGTSMFSWLIQRKTRSRYSHVGVALWVRFNGGVDRLFLAESLLKSGVQLIALSTTGNFDWFTFDEDLAHRPVWTSEAECFIAERVGRTPYDRLSIIRTAIGLSMKDDNRMTCNELAARIGSKTGVVFTMHKHTQSPRGIADAWLENGASMVRVVNE